MQAAWSSARTACERCAGRRLERDRLLGADRGAAAALLEAGAELVPERRVGLDREVGHDAGEEEPRSELRRQEHLVEPDRAQARRYRGLPQQERALTGGRGVAERLAAQVGDDRRQDGGDRVMLLEPVGELGRRLLEVARRAAGGELAQRVVGRRGDAGRVAAGQDDQRLEIARQP